MMKLVKKHCLFLSKKNVKIFNYSVNFTDSKFIKKFTKLFKKPIFLYLLKKKELEAD